jgi:hypothetical protein
MKVEVEVKVKVKVKIVCCLVNKFTFSVIPGLTRNPGVLTRFRLSPE